MHGRPGQISHERGFTMIATHNIKVNGRWYSAGDVIPDAAQKQAELPVEPVKEEPENAPKTPAEEPKEEPKAQPRAKSAARRKSR